MKKFFFLKNKNKVCEYKNFSRQSEFFDLNGFFRKQKNFLVFFFYFFYFKIYFLFSENFFNLYSKKKFFSYNYFLDFKKKRTFFTTLRKNDQFIIEIKRKFSKLVIFLKISNLFFFKILKKFYVFLNFLNNKSQQFFEFLNFKKIFSPFFFSKFFKIFFLIKKTILQQIFFFLIEKISKIKFLKFSKGNKRGIFFPKNNNFFFKKFFNFYKQEKNYFALEIKNFVSPLLNSSSKKKKFFPNCLNGRMIKKKTVQCILNKEKKFLKNYKNNKKKMFYKKESLKLFFQNFKKYQKNLKIFEKKIFLGQTSDKKNINSVPIFFLKKELLNAISLNHVLVVIGETGCGKTTQIPQFLNQENPKKKICCTQPRRISAVNVAKKVADEMRCKIGEKVGYSIRFEERSSELTLIKYLTDGMLLCEILSENKMSCYDIIIIDEAHERTIATDILLGLLKIYIKKNKKIKLIITSATLNVYKFSSYFWNCPIFSIPGKLYPIDNYFLKNLPFDFIQKIVQIVWQIHFFEKPGDILVFLTGQEDIEIACELTRNLNFSPLKNFHYLIIFAIYSSLPFYIQKKIFQPLTFFSRKCIFSTNLTETSLTIEGIIFVVDSGFIKQKFYNPEIGIDVIMTVPESRANSKQRTGRAGRTCKGKCFKIFTEYNFLKEFPFTPIPELQRTDLTSVLLTIKGMGIENIENIDFIDHPPILNINNSLESLYALGCVDKFGLLTTLGKTISLFPIDPFLSRVLIKSYEAGCEEKISIIISMLSVQNIFLNKKKFFLMNFYAKKFPKLRGDHLILLFIYESWKKSKWSSNWCYNNNFNFKSLQTARDIKKQLAIVGKNYNKKKKKNISEKIIQKIFISGFFLNSAFKLEGEQYVTVIKKTRVFLSSKSILNNQPFRWVLFHELTESSKVFMKECLAIKPIWLVKLVPRFFFLFF